jgi:tRNA dimethylallyltransferase
VSVAPEIARAADAIAESCAREGAMPAIVGPTGTGKTALACALAERLGGEVVSVDSVQVYRGVNLGSGKPSAEELARAPHHLVSAVDLDAPMDAGRFVTLADEAIANVRARGKAPVLCGGTFLWMKALVEGLAEMPPASEELRATYARIAEEEGRAALHERLRAVDPPSAAKLGPNDFVRVSRALEVHALTGKTLSEHHAAHGFRTARHTVQYAGILVEEPRYTAMLTARVEAWLAAGWVDEVRALRSEGHGAARALGSVGFAEVAAHLEGQLPLAELAPSIVRATRVFARRQRTWLKSASVTWLPLSNDGARAGTRPKRSAPGA